MTSEEKDLINQIRSEKSDLRAREKAMVRLGECLEETFILDLLPSKQLMTELEKIADKKSTPPSVKRKAKSLIKKYAI